MPSCAYALQIGFLYLRYVCDPRKLWDWTRHYMQDDEVRTAWSYRPTVPPPCTPSACAMLAGSGILLIGKSGLHC